MAKCPSCGNQLAENSRFCNLCGQTVNADTFATRTVATSSSRPPSKTASSDSRFPPGTVLAGRYRIVSLLGKGGMGEVYRAEDLTLDQQVALKFLPASLSSNSDTLTRFRNEVRVARQVSHPNVCRVYDVGELDGHVFLSMEYVDGEDLASLLRRIGRLPSDKGIEIARKLCAGLAAAHEKGVLHRDLKPSNVMLDARGHVLLTDFGLAGLADQIAGSEVRNGTPAYMAPEQLAGKEVTSKSDIYALGLVLYEIFTGKRPFDAATLAELVQAQTQSTPTSLTSLVRDLDPVVERVILRCLDPDPSRRPSSALAVAAALPGADPLAAALAAGETPSPEMVAAAGEGTGLSPGIAIAVFAVAMVLLAGCYALALNRSALEKLNPEYSPEVLTQKARDVIQRLGYSSAPVDSACGLDWDSKYINHVQAHDKPAPNWSQVLKSAPSPLKFWYRESPTPLIADAFHDDLLTPGIVDAADPAPIDSGMTMLILDSLGRLLAFERIPAQVQEPAKDIRPVDWSPLLAAAGVDPAQLQSVEPIRTWLATSDTRVAWIGKWPGTGRELRVEAAAWRGKPVAFLMIGPWTGSDRMPVPPSSGEQGQLIIIIAISLAIMIGGGFLAGRNMAQGKGDQKGATRLAVWVLFIQMGLWVCRSHLVMSEGTFGMFLIAMATSVFYAFVVRTVYIALEPHVRRRWPQTLISSTAVLSNRWRDPIVGRDVLVGITLELVLRFADALTTRLALGSDAAPYLGPTDVLLGIRSTLAVCMASVPHCIRDTLMLFFVLFLLRVLLRNPWAAGAAFALLFATLQALGSSHPWMDGFLSFIFHGVVALVILRFGLLALSTTIFVEGLLSGLQPTLHTSAWYFGSDMFLLAIVIALAGWGCYTSMAGTRLWKHDLFESV